VFYRRGAEGEAESDRGVAPVLEWAPDRQAAAAQRRSRRFEVSDSQEEPGST
jgi:hypothetical protein